MELEEDEVTASDREECGDGTSKWTECLRLERGLLLLRDAMR